jgi:GNAT superfamily N-acetyltransferase
MAAHGFSWLLMAARDCSYLVAGLRWPGLKSLSRMGASPMLLPAWRGHALGRDLLRAAGRNALPKAYVRAGLYL